MAELFKKRIDDRTDSRSFDRLGGGQTRAVLRRLWGFLVPYRGRIFACAAHRSRKPLFARRPPPFRRGNRLHFRAGNCGFSKSVFFLRLDAGLLPATRSLFLPAQRIDGRIESRADPAAA